LAVSLGIVLIVAAAVVLNRSFPRLPRNRSRL
jgi:hypothetical protein